MKSHKVIIDTNLWISYLISRDYSSIDSLIESKKITLIFSKELMDEFLTVIRRPRLRKYFSDEELKELLRIFDKYGKLKVVKSDIKECRDYKDNFLLNLAIDSSADFLVTGDTDLLVLEKIGKTKIITINQLIDTIK